VGLQQVVRDESVDRLAKPPPLAAYEIRAWPGALNALPGTQATDASSMAASHHA